MVSNSKNANDSKGDNSVYYSCVANFSSLEEENRLLRETVNQLRNELVKFKSNPLMVCEVVETFEDSTAVIKIPNGNSFMVNVTKDCGKISSGDSVLVEQKNLTVVKKTFKDKKFNVEQFVIVEKPKLKWGDIGGLKQQIQEVKEVIELPLKKPETVVSYFIA
jgi:proteasome regulatory subunit